MLKINVAAVLVSAVAAFVIGGLWYSPLLFGNVYQNLRGLTPEAAGQAAMPASEVIGEFARWLVITFVLARFMTLLSIGGLGNALQFGVWAWVAVYAALAGSVLHEGYAWRLYAIHAGDGLAKIAVITAILRLWPSR